MSLDALIATLVSEAEAQIEGELSAARAEAAAASAAADQRIEARHCGARADREASRSSAVERGLLQARSDALRSVLEARQSFLNRVFEAARRRFPEALRSPRYRAGLAGSVTEALACMGERPVTLRCSPDLVADLKRAVGDGRVSVVTDPSVGAGFRAVAHDGSMEVDATLDTRLAAMAATLSLEALKSLEQSP